MSSGLMRSAFRLALRATFAAAGLCALAAKAQPQTTVHGLWVWKGPSIVASAHGAEDLRDFCRAQGINEIYISVSSQGTALAGDFPRLVDLLHRSEIHVEALLSSPDADEAGKHREKLLDEVREVVRFNQNHPKRRFDGIHLDIEPQQRPENKGEGNLRFLAGLVDAYRAVRQIADPAGLPVNADIQKKLLKGDAAQRKLLMTALPRLTLMLYEVSGANDGDTPEKKIEKIQAASQKFLKTAYEGLDGNNLAKLVIGLRTPDYGSQLPDALASLDKTNGENPHYAGWARHSYNDTLSTR